MQNGSARRALVLSGGGARGAYEAGVVTALFEREQFEIVCGTSIGAINAAVAAQGATDQLRPLWRGVPERAVIRGVSPIEEFRTVFGRSGSRRKRTLRAFAADVARAVGALRFARPQLVRRMTHLLDPAPLVEMLNAVLKRSELQRTLIVGVTNLTRARPEAFYWFPEADVAFERTFAEEEAASVRLVDENYVAAILASAAIPLAFPNVSLADRDGIVCDYIDGGVGNNTPIRQAIDAGADEITVVIADHIALRDRDHRMEDFGSIALVAQDIMQQQVLELDLKLTRRVNEAVLRGAAPGKRFVKIRTIGPSINIPLPILGFADLETIDRAFDQGLIDGRGACEATGLSRLFANDPTARHVAPGDVLFHEGDTGDELFVVIDGEFEIVSRGSAIATLGTGAVAGELAMLGSGARRASVIARSAGTVAPVDSARFAYLVRYAPTFALTVLRSLSNLLEAIVAPTVPEAVEAAGPAAATQATEAKLDVGGAAVMRTFAAGDVIFRAGDPGDTMFFIDSGEVRIGAGAADQTIAGAGDVFGEMALVDHQPRSASAVAVTDTRIVPIDELRFTELVQNNPNFAISVMRSVAKRILAKADEYAVPEPQPAVTPGSP
jgi:CRP-like cAMP-binding protein/predicted acylesterase/phospholipase RssA